MKVFLTKFHYKKNFSIIEKVLYFPLYVLLALPTIAYWSITKTRNFLYKKDILKKYNPKIYTISVGNLTTGGTGKTPITAEIANYFAQKGDYPAILSRGYGGTISNKNVNIISDGNTINFGATEAGDEPFWLAKHCPKVAVLTCSSRVNAAKFAKTNLNCTKLILDDGYQHQKLERNLNILVIDSEKQFSNGSVLPLGALREPISEVKRADKIIVVNKSINEKKAKSFANLLKKKYNKPLFICNMEPADVYNIQTKKIIDDSMPVIAFCAIGQPEQFYKYLQRYDIMATKSYPDHHLYTKDDIEELKNLMKKNDAKCLITTEKDAVKIQALLNDNEQIYALKLKPSLDLRGLLDE